MTIEASIKVEVKVEAPGYGSAKTEQDCGCGVSRKNREDGIIRLRDDRFEISYSITLHGPTSLALFYDVLLLLWLWLWPLISGL